MGVLNITTEFGSSRYQEIRQQGVMSWKKSYSLTHQHVPSPALALRKSEVSPEWKHRHLYITSLRDHDLILFKHVLIDIH